MTTRERGQRTKHPRMSDPDRTPVLVGIGVSTQREDNHARAVEPMDLMLRAVAAAIGDTGAPSIAQSVDYIAVPKGRWSYRNPSGEIARTIGADAATTVLATVGVLQQTLIGEACARIARGESRATLVAGSDAGYRLLRAQIAGQQAAARQQDDEPHITMAPAEELRHPVEKQAGLTMPVGLYAIMESAYRARHGLTVAAHRDRIADLCARMSRIAADNPCAWSRKPVEAAWIREASDRNPAQAFPYNRAHCSTWNVDQAAALLFCSEARAVALGIPREAWVYPAASVQSNHMVPVIARADLSACPGARIAGQAALSSAGLSLDEVDLIELYSCFPLAVETYADALGISLARDLSVTGGMPFAGGPYNNYVLQATCRAAELIRSGRGRNALISSVSGVLTKQGFGVLAKVRPPNDFVDADVSDDVAREMQFRDVVASFSGDARIAGYTVLHGRDQAPRGIAVVDLPDGRRSIATTTEPALTAAMMADEFVGRSLRVSADGGKVAIDQCC